MVVSFFALNRPVSHWERLASVPSRSSLQAQTEVCKPNSACVLSPQKSWSLESFFLEHEKETWGGTCSLVPAVRVSLKGFSHWVGGGGG